MSWTVNGLGWIATRLRADLEGATLVIGNGQQAEGHRDEELAGEFTAEAPISEVEDVGEVQVDGELRHRVILRAIFGEDTANFDWNERGVRLADGTLVDRKVQDQGRKVQGSVWTLEAVLDLVP